MPGRHEGRSSIQSMGFLDRSGISEGQWGAVSCILFHCVHKWSSLCPVRVIVEVPMKEALTSSTHTFEMFTLWPQIRTSDVSHKNRHMKCSPQLLSYCGVILCTRVFKEMNVIVITYRVISALWFDLYMLWTFFSTPDGWMYHTKCWTVVHFFPVHVVWSLS